MPTPTQPAPGTPAANPRQLWAYLLVLASLTLLLYPLPWLLLRLPSFERWGGSGYGPVLDYAFQTQGQNADIVLFGDSSEVIGIDPSALSRTLGLKVVALPNSIGSLRLTGDIALTRYLRTNRPPRLIVLYVTPWNLDYAHNTNNAVLYEGEEMLFRHGTAAQIWAFFRADPADTLLFPLRFYQVNPHAALTSWLKHLHPAERTAATSGHYDPLSMIPPFAGPCTFPAGLLQPVPFDSAEAFRTRYTTPATRVLVYNAPIPACTNAAPLLQRSYAALAAAPPVTLPPADFKGDDYYVHPAAAGMPPANEALRQAISVLLRGTASAVP